ncbi:ATP phosphoribosyltransferase regulatory subunit [Lachnospiraceae bacterium JLR.KK008]
MRERLVHTPEGVRDIYGEEYAKKLAVEEKIQQVFHSYGYQDIQTPSFEFFEVFSREIGTKPSKELYKFFDKEGNTLVLRPDFTPSIARCAAKYFIGEDRPLRFCYLGNSFSNTSELQGKLKEMTQMGSELIGDDSVQADAETVAVVIESLLGAGLSRFQVSIGEVEYYKGICEAAGLSEEMELELRGYISTKNYFGAEDFLIREHVPQEQRGVLLKSAELFGGAEILQEARQSVSGDNRRSLAAIDRLEQIYQVLCVYGLENYVSFDLGMLSKYRYYTGIILRAYTYGVGDAIVTGGRYDKLLGYFGREKPAVGFMIAIDALMEAIARQKLPVSTGRQVSVITYREESAGEAIAQAQERRRAGEWIELIPEGKEQ